MKTTLSAPTIEANLSHQQQRIWIDNQLHPEKQAFWNIYREVLIPRQIDYEALNRAFHTIVQKHGVLRTSFIEKDGQPVQIMHESLSIDRTQVHHYQNLDEKEARSVIQKDQNTLHDLEQAPLCRLYLFTLNDGYSIIYFNIHHLITDATSNELFTQDLNFFYQQHLKQRPIPTALSSTNYFDFIRDQEANRWSETARKYWINKFPDQIPTLNLPNVATGSPKAISTLNTINFLLDKSLSSKIKDFCNERALVPLSWFLSCLALLLSKYTQEKSIVIGSPFAGRSEDSRYDEVMGFFINLLPFYIQIDPKTSPLDLLKSVQKQVRKSFRHQDYPFQYLIEDLRDKLQDRSTTLFNVTMQHLRLNDKLPGDLEHLAVTKKGIVPQFDLEFNIYEHDHQIRIGLDYDAGKFSTELITRMLQNFQEIAHSLLADEVISIDKIDYLHAAELYQTTAGFNDTKTEFESTNVVACFERQALENGHKVAVFDGEQRRTFAYLNQKANQLANHLRENLAISKESVIAICMKNTEHRLVAILATLKLGCVYLPIDVRFPFQRKKMLIEDAEPVGIITHSELDLGAAKETKEINPKVFAMAQLANKPDLNSANPTIPIAGDDAAYLIYTSGSTGKPKGVLVEHLGLYNRLHWMWHEMGFTGNDIILHKTPFVFDVSVWEILMPLSFGCQVVLMSEDHILDVNTIQEYLSKYRITTIHFVPSVYQIFLEFLRSQSNQVFHLKRVISSGEALKQGCVNDHYKIFTIPLFNLYGPTEASIDVTFDETGKDEPITIGKPINNTAIYILDDQLSPVPIGAIGHLYIGGIGLARGYFQNETLTKDKFIPHPFEAGERLYKSGDLASWDHQGKIYYHGRDDYQIKIHGNRVELGEIEKHIESLPTVKEAVCLFIESHTGDYITACYTGQPDESEAIQNHLAHELPAHMIPKAYQWFEQFPLTNNGKVDKKQLQAQTALVNQPTKTTRNWPKSDQERQIATIWEEVLNTTPVGVNDSFFQLGGNSLLLIKMMAQVKADLFIDFKVTDFFQKPTIEFLCQGNHQVATPIQIEKAPVKPFYNASHAQKRLWLISQIPNQSLQYHVPIFMEFYNPNPESLEWALQKLVERYEILRTNFSWENNEVVQIIHPVDQRIPTLEIVNQTDDINQKMHNSINQPFDLEHDELIRGTLYMQNGEATLLLVLHHIITDAHSNELIIEKLETLYEERTENNKAVEQPIPLQYKDFSEWQNQWIIDHSDEDAPYWKNKLVNLPPAICFDQHYTSIKSKPTCHRKFIALSKSDWQAMHDPTLTKFMLTLALLKVTIASYTKQFDLTIGSAISDREFLLLEKQIGFFTNTLALRTKLDPELTLKAAIQRVKQTCLEAFEHQRYPYDLIVEDLELKGKDLSKPVFNVFFDFKEQNEVLGRSILQPEVEINFNKFDLMWSILIGKNGVMLEIEYDQAFIAPHQVEQLVSTYESLLTNLHAVEQLSIQALEIHHENEFNPKSETFKLHEIDQAISGLGLSERSITFVEERDDNTPVRRSFIILKSGFDPQHLKSDLKSKLPSDLTPDTIHLVDAFPIQTPGRLDKQLLLKEQHTEQPTPISINRTSGNAPSKKELQIIDIWGAVLGISTDQIGTDANFFELGGQSLLLTKMVARVKAALNLDFKVTDFFLDPTITFLTQAKRQNGKSEQLSKAQDKPYYKASHAQKRLWTISQIPSQSLQYHVPILLEFRNPDIEALRWAVEKLVHRYEILRTHFEWQQEEVVQVIRPFEKGSPSLNIVTETDEPNTLILKEINQPFDLAEGNLIRFTLFQGKTGNSTLLIVLHHIITDAHSNEIIIEMLKSYYKAGKKDRLETNEPLAWQFKDFSEWQNQEIANHSQDDAKYWKSQLSDPPTTICFEPSMVKADNEKGGVRKFIAIDPNRWKIGEEQNLTKFIVSLAALKIIIARYTDQYDLTIGTVVSDRALLQLEDQIGFFTNTLPLRTRLEPGLGLEQAVMAVKHTCLDAFEHQSYPYDLILDSTGIQSVFNIMFDYKEVDESLDNSMTQRDLEFNLNKFDMTWSIMTGPNGAILEIEYDQTFISAEQVRQLMNSYEILLTDIQSKSQEQIGKLNLLPEADEFKIARTFNTPRYPHVNHETVLRQFESCASKFPNKLALSSPKGSLSYQELNSVANQLARYLTDRKQIKPQDHIAICLENSLEAIISIFATLKLKCAYVPIDPNFPMDRQNYIASDSQSKLILKTEDFIPFWQAQDQYDDQNLDVSIGSDDVAYIIYTSGSTGKPKGCMIQHASVANFIQSQKHNLEFTHDEQVLLASHLSFDASVEQIFLALTQAATLHIVDKSTLLDPLVLEHFIRNKSISFIHLIPSLLLTLTPGHYPSLKRVITGGEVCPEELIRKWIPYHVFINEYGPTETTVAALQNIMDRSSSELTLRTIGRPLDNAYIFILNPQLGIQPIGVPGEIWIAGPGVAKGYWNRPELTAEKFRNIVVRGETFYAYKTGDWGKWTEDGQVIFLGRKDDLVKIRGYRIELTEIDHVISANSLVERSVTLVDHADPDNPTLRSFIIPKSGLDQQKLTEEMESQLPNYMIPNSIKFVDAFPIQPNGKLDKQMLLAEYQKSALTPSLLADHRNLSEKELEIIQIWSTVLGIPADQIGIEDNFFKLGGHSLLLIKMVTRLKDALNLDFKVTNFFRDPTIAFLTKAEGSSYVPEHISKAPVQSVYQASHAQKRLWSISQIPSQSLQYHVPVFLTFRDPDIAALQWAAERLVDRYEILRTNFEWQHDEVVQIIRSFDQRIPTLNVVEGIDDINPLMLDEINRPFDLARGELIRFTLFNKKSGHATLLLVLHHIVTDAHSNEILNESLKSFYKAGKNDRIDPQDPLELQYKDFSEWHNQQIAIHLEEDARFWNNQLKGLPPALCFEQPTIEPDHKSRCIRKFINLDPDCWNIDENQNLTKFILALAVFKISIARYTDQYDLTIGTVVSDRSLLQLEDQIGFFTNTLPLRTPLESDLSLEQAILAVRKTCLDAFEHQRYPYDLILENLGLSSVFNVFFDFTEVYELLDESMTQPDLEINFNKFDITWSILAGRNGVVLEVEYDEAFIASSQIEQLASTYEILLTNIQSQRDQKLGLLEVLPQSQRFKIINTFNHSKPVQAPVETVLSWFEYTVANYPSKVALVGTDQQWTYEALNKKANQLARYLINTKGIHPFDRIAICIINSVEAITSIIAIFKLQCTYVPIDPNFPEERQQYIVNDSACKLQLNPATFDQFQRSADQYDSNNVPNTSRPGDLAYIIYTSGSAGKPKGCMVQHGSISNLIQSQKENFQFGDDEKVLLASHISFDASIEQIFLPLSNSGSLHLVERKTLLDSTALSEYITSKAITHIHLVPSLLLNVAPKHYPALRRVIAGGEVCPVKLIKDWIPFHTFINEYGPTETTVTALQNMLDASSTEDSLRTIGQPIGSARVFILNSDRALQPIGIPGEIWIAGPGVAQGYLNRSELTAERFRNIVIEDEIVYAYKTGDWGKWTEQGQVIFLGRKDDQVKIRGYRIELTEIDQVIGANGLVERVISLLDKHDPDNPVLRSFIIPKPGFDQERLYQEMESKLPSYMIPNSITLVDSFPIHANGKLNKRTLLAEFQNEEPSRGIDIDHSNLTENERTLIQIWSTVLGISADQIGPAGNFLKLGGHSLKLIQAMNKINETFQTNYPSYLLMEYPNIRDLARFIAHPLPQKHSVAVALNGSGLERVLCIPGAGGDLLPFTALATQLEREKSLEACVFPGLYDDRPPLDSVTALSRQIQKVITSDSATLVGYSFGARVAYQMAIESPVSHLIVVDAISPHLVFDQFLPGKQESQPWSIAHVYAQLKKIQLPRSFSDLEGASHSEQVREITEYFREIGFGDKNQEFERFIKVFQGNLTAVKQPIYQGRLDIPIHLFKATKGQFYELEDELGLEEDWGWKKCTNAEVICHDISSDHWSILNKAAMEMANLIRRI